MDKFTWEGVPIQDIRAWCRARGERMVRYHAEREIVSLFSLRMKTETYDGEMPESFYDTLRWGEGWVYHELERYRP